MMPCLSVIGHCSDQCMGPLLFVDVWYAMVVGKAQWWLMICSWERRRKFAGKTDPGCFENNSQFLTKQKQKQKKQTSHDKRTTAEAMSHGRTILSWWRQHVKSQGETDPQNKWAGLQSSSHWAAQVLKECAVMERWTKEAIQHEKQCSFIPKESLRLLEKKRLLLHSQHEAN